MDGWMAKSIYVFIMFSCIYGRNFLQNLPVEPCKKAFGRGDQVHHRGKEVVGQLARGSAVVVAAAPPACDEVLQVLGRCIELMRKSLQILSLQPIILRESKSKFTVVWPVWLCLFCLWRVIEASSTVRAERGIPR